MMGKETLSDIVAEMRSIKYYGDECTVKWCLTEWADRIEAAAKRDCEAAREETNDDTTLVMGCEICANYDKKRQYCPVHDLMVARCCSVGLPVLDTGPCDRWKSRFAKNGKGGTQWLNQRNRSRPR